MAAWRWLETKLLLHCMSLHPALVVGRTPSSGPLCPIADIRRAMLLTHRRHGLHADIAMQHRLISKGKRWLCWQAHASVTKSTGEMWAHNRNRCAAFSRHFRGRAAWASSHFEWIADQRSRRAAGDRGLGLAGSEKYRRNAWHPSSHWWVCQLAFQQTECISLGMPQCFRDSRMHDAAPMNVEAVSQVRIIQ